MPRIFQENLMEICMEILEAVGVSEDKAKFLVGNLIRSDLRGIRSHGINHFSMYINLIETGTIDPEGEPQIVRETPSTAVIDANMGFGQIACQKAAELAVEKARENVVGAVAVLNSAHAGHIGDYTRMILDKDMIGIMYLNCDKGVVPYGGKDIVLGTNPISYAIPAGEEDPIIVDFATSACAGGHLMDRLRKGEKIPDGWAIDSSGHVATNPKDLFKDPSFPLRWGDNFVGALLPAAGHKGYGLALAVDVLTGALTGGKCDGDVVEGENFAFLQAIDPEGFVPRREYEKRVDKLIKACRSSSPQAGIKEVLIPGDLERRAEREALELGISIEENLWEELSNIGKKYSVDVNKIIR